MSVQLPWSESLHATDIISLCFFLIWNETERKISDETCAAKTVLEIHYYYYYYLHTFCLALAPLSLKQPPSPFQQASERVTPKPSAYNEEQGFTQSS